MAWSDAGQRPEAMPVACTGCDFAVSNRPAVSTPATATYRCRSQSITASGMIYDHVSINSHKAKDGTITYHVRVRRKGEPTQCAVFPTLSQARKYATMVEG